MVGAVAVVVVATVNTRGRPDGTIETGTENRRFSAFAPGGGGGGGGDNTTGVLGRKGLDGTVEMFKTNNVHYDRRKNKKKNVQQ